MEQAKKFAQTASAPPMKKKDEIKDDEAPLNEDGLTPNHITMVMDHGNCSRNAAIKALRETNDDMV